jgi:hypothetical protein
MGLDFLNVEDGGSTFIQFLGRCSYTEKAEGLTQSVVLKSKVNY